MHALWARLAGNSLIVTRFGRNPAREIQQTLLRFPRNNGIDIKGANFQRVKRKKHLRTGMAITVIYSTIQVRYQVIGIGGSHEPLF